MHALGRREFLGLSLGGLAAASFGEFACAKDLKSLSEKDTLFLTWQRDPTTTMTVQWICPPLSETPSINYHARGGGSIESIVTKHHAYPKTDLRVYRAELTGLKPGTEYEFKISGHSTTRHFRTMPAKLNDSFTFISGGDCDTNDHAVKNNIQAAKQNPMFTLIGGDLGYDNGTSVEHSIDFVRNYSKHMIDGEGRMIPMVVCIGNHEVAGGYGKTRKDAPFYFALHDGLYKDHSYATLDFGDYLSLVLLDSGHVAPIEGAQTAWLQQQLKDRIDLPHVFAANHVPSFPSHRKMESTFGKTGTGEMSRRFWVPLFERYNVDAVFEHHDHTFKRTHPLKDGMINASGVVYLGDGSWGKLRAPEPPEDRPYLAVSSENYHFSVHRIEGAKCHHIAMSESGRVVDETYITSKRPMRAKGRGA